MPISKSDIDTIRRSSYFNGDWYRQRYPDVDMVGMDPAEHYLWLGAALGRDPSPLFSSREYLALNPDVQAKGINPLLHYLKWGQKEGRPRQFASVPVKSEKLEGKVRPRSGVPTILLCAHEANQQLFGGERSFLDVLRAFFRLGANIYVTLPQQNNERYIEELARHCCGVFVFFYPLWQRNKSVDEYVVNEFSRIIDSEDIDVVYANTIMLREAQLAAKRLDKISACHVRELIEYDEHLKKRIGLSPEKIVRDITRRSTHIVANSRFTASAFASHHNVIHAPNVVDPDILDIPNTINGSPVFGIISSNVPKKGIADFVEIAKISEKNSVNARFVIVGPENPFIAELLAGGFPANLTFAGYADTPLEALQKVNVVLSLSHFAESFGRTIAEAQAARRPVIAYEWGAIPELIQPEVTGILVPFRDVVAAASAVATLASDPARIIKMGEEGRKAMVAHYAPPVLEHQLKSILNSVAANHRRELPRSTARVTVIVPIYNAPEDVRACLSSLGKWTDFSRARVLMIDDGSPSPEIAPLTKEFANKEGFALLVNEKNIGYTRTINRGIKEAGTDDVVLLNSDTVVTPGWLEGLLRAAETHPEVGTVTAMSDNAGAFSFPTMHVRNPKPALVPPELWATLIVAAAQDCKPVEVPTGNGFCLFIKRSLIDKIGIFDEKSFPRGYGEENEFCMRALSKGWRHVISPYSYVFHERSKSFGGEKSKLIEEGAATLAKMYPSYAQKVKRAFSSEAMARLRVATESVYSAEFTDGSYDAWVQSIQSGDPAESEDRFAHWNKILINWKLVDAGLEFRDPNLTSIIICVLDNPGITKKCIDSLLLHSRGERIEIILVNNGSRPHTSALLEDMARKHSVIRLINNHCNLNFALGNNLGFAASRGGKVIFLNNDTEVGANWLPPLLRALDNGRVMGAQPKLLYPDGNLQCVGIVFPDQAPFGYPIYADRKDDGKLASSPRSYRAITAACMALRASDFAVSRGFDPVFINGQEDVDLCLRLGKGAAVFAYVPESTVVHHEAKSSGRGRHIQRNRTLFASRWRGKYKGDDHAYYAKDGFIASDYKPDSAEYQNAGIALWRPQSVTPRK